MAVTELGDQLTQLHMRQQAALRAGTVKDVVRLFPGLDLSSVGAVDRSWPTLQAALEALIRQRFGDSSGLALNYYQLFRAAEGIAGEAAPRIAGELAAEQLDVALRVTGPYTAKHLLAQSDGQVAQKTLVRLSGAVSRLVATGGRDALENTVRADKRALGWARVVSGRGCGFCRLLRSRGAVYKTETTSRFRAHDHCGCSSEPVYRRNQPLPPGSVEDRELYDRVTAGLKGKAAIEAFRKAVEG